MHVGLQDWASEIDMRKLTLAEITLMGTYTYSTADLRATVALLARGAFGDLSWVERRPLDEGRRPSTTWTRAAGRGQGRAQAVISGQHTASGASRRAQPMTAKPCESFFTSTMNWPGAVVRNV